jgi:hypothetical protein
MAVARCTFQAAFRAVGCHLAIAPQAAGATSKHAVDRFGPASSTVPESVLASDPASDDDDAPPVPGGAPPFEVAPPLTDPPLDVPPLPGTPPLDVPPLLCATPPAPRNVLGDPPPL